MTDTIKPSVLTFTQAPLIKTCEQPWPLLGITKRLFALFISSFKRPLKVFDVLYMEFNTIMSTDKS